MVTWFIQVALQLLRVLTLGTFQKNLTVPLLIPCRLFPPRLCVVSMIRTSIRQISCPTLTMVGPRTIIYWTLFLTDIIQIYVRRDVYHLPLA